MSGQASRGRTRAGRAGRSAATLVLLLLLAAGAAHARGKRYGIEGKFLGYDPARQVVSVYVTNGKVGGFGGSTVGGKAPKDIEVRQEREFAVKPEGSVLSRTVIKSAGGTGLDNSGTQEGFDRAVQAIPQDRVLAFSVEENADHAKKPDSPKYRIKTIVIKMSEEELQRRLQELFDDEDEG